MCTAKERLLWYFYNTINRSNNLVPNVDVTEAGCKSIAKSKGKEEKKKISEEQAKEYNSFKYKFFLGKGNNYPLVWTILK